MPAKQKTVYQHHVSVVIDTEIILLLSGWGEEGLFKTNQHCVRVHDNFKKDPPQVRPVAKLTTAVHHVNAVA